MHAVICKYRISSFRCSRQKFCGGQINPSWDIYPCRLEVAAFTASSLIGIVEIFLENVTDQVIRLLSTCRARVIVCSICRLRIYKTLQNMRLR